MLELRLLGQFEVYLDGVKLETAWPRRHARDVLQLLALQPQMRLHKEQVIEAIWPDEDAEKRLYYVLHALRKTLEPTLSQPSKSRYVVYQDNFLQLREAKVDVQTFEEKLNQKNLEEALELYRGDLLGDNLYAAWLETERERLKQRYVAALAQLLELYQNDTEKTPRLLERLITAEPSEVHYRKLITFYGERGNLHEATRHYQRCLEFLRDLGVEPDAETETLLETLRGQQQPLPLPIAVSSFPLLSTPILGRDKELREVGRLLSRGTRLVTLTGPAGVGKTRLALELASSLQAQFSHGVVTLSLAALQAPELFIPALRQGLGASGDVGQYLKEKNLLLVLDNCEHLPDALPYVATLLEAAPLVSVLATSRTPLHLRGETCAEVKPLLLQSAVDLFQMRVKAVQPTLEISPEETVAIAKLCQELDALPLAIELAAARRTILSIQAIRQRLNERLDFKNTERNSPERHRSLRTALEWSLSLLSEESKTLFTSLGVFAGPFGLEEAAEICNIASGALLEALEPLLEHRLLVTSQREGQHVFYMLETVKAYAVELLLQSSDTKPRENHATYFLQLVEETEKLFNRGKPDKANLDKLELSYPDIRAALSYVFEADVSRAVRFATSLGFFWYFRAYYAEGKSWHEKVLPFAQTEEAQFGMYRGLAGLNSAEGNMKEAKRYMDQILLLPYTKKDTKQYAATLSNVAMLTANLEGIDKSKPLYDKVLTLLSDDDTLPATSIRGTALYNIGSLLIEAGRLDEAEPYLEQALEFSQRLNHEHTVVHVLASLATIALGRDKIDLAESLAKRSLELAQKLKYAALEVAALLRLAQVDIARHQLDIALDKLLNMVDSAKQLDKSSLANVLLILSFWGLAKREYSWATRVLSVAQSLHNKTDEQFPQYEGSLYLVTKQRLTDSLGEHAFKTAWQIGASQSLEDVLATIAKNTFTDLSAKVESTNTKVVARH
jgi:predicted ATPase/DNA-binding SARP family transcriptional activator/Tfp pilus assembly protein PilF